MLKLACWITAGLLIVGCTVIVLPLVFTSACDSSPLSMGFIWLREIQDAQLEVRKGILGPVNPEGGYWRKDIRELDSCLVHGRRVGLINARIAESDVGGTVTKIDRPLPEISLHTLSLAGEPPLDYTKYAVIMWVHEWGRLGWWTLISSQNGVWGKPGKNELEHFPADPLGEGWLPEPEVKRILSKERRLDRWLNFWGLK